MDVDEPLARIDRTIADMVAERTAAGPPEGLVESVLASLERAGAFAAADDEEP
jgi:hypothetical protein